MKPWFKLCLTTAITNSTIDLAENGILKIWSGLVGTEIIFGVNIWVSGTKFRGQRLKFKVTRSKFLKKLRSEFSN